MLAPPAVAGRARTMAAGALVAALLAAALTWMVLSSGLGGAPPHATSGRAVTVGSAAVTVPAGWALERRADALPGLGAPAEVLAPAPGLSAHAVIVMSPDGLAAPLRELLGDLGRGRSETLAGLPAIRYAPRPVGGGRVADLTVAETTSGTLAVACIAREESWTGAAGCADAITAGPGLRAAL